jgi:hypothetical protein
MSSHYHAIVWIDHHEARIFHFNVSEVDRLVLHPHKPTRHIHHKANSIGNGHASSSPTPASISRWITKCLRELGRAGRRAIIESHAG